MSYRFVAHAGSAIAMLAGIRGATPTSAEARAVAGSFAEVRHTKLLHSSPTADATLQQSPTAVTLWFTKAVQPKLTRVRIATAAGTAIDLEAPRAVDAGDTSVVTGLHAPLSNGSYTVTWATTSRDSHVIKGSYHFRVQ